MFMSKRNPNIIFEVIAASGVVGEPDRWYLLKDQHGEVSHVREEWFLLNNRPYAQQLIIEVRQPVVGDTVVFFYSGRFNMETLTDEHIIDTDPAFVLVKKVN